MTGTADALVTQRHALVHTEPMLFIDNHERELFELDAFLEQRVRTDHNLSAAVSN